ncbi:MAG: cytochrome c [Sneathiellaceae bacterium]
MKKPTRLRTLAAAVLAVAVTAGVGAAMAQDVIKERQAGFKQNVDNMKAMAASLKGGDVKAMQPRAEAIAAWAAKIPGMFPKGSGEGDTAALPTIWTDWDGFTAAADANGKAAKHLAMVVADGGDAAAAGAALKALGGTCGACHDKFRAKKE